MLLDLPIKPILALDFTSLLAIFFVLFSLFGFISNLLKKLSGDDQPQVQGRQPRRRDGELQGEIDNFLKEVLGGKAPQKPKPRPQPKHQERSHQEADNVPERRRFAESQANVEAAPERRQQPRTKPPQRQRPRPQQQRNRRDQKPASPVFDEEPEQTRPLKDRHIQSSVEGHVDSYMQSHLDDNRDEGVLPNHPRPSKLISIFDDDNELKSQATNDFAEEMRTLFASPTGIRQVIIANEILSKPKALR